MLLLQSLLAQHPPCHHPQAFRLCLLTRPPGLQSRRFSKCSLSALGLTQQGMGPLSWFLQSSCFVGCVVGGGGSGGGGGGVFVYVLGERDGDENQERSLGDVVLNGVKKDVEGVVR